MKRHKILISDKFAARGVVRLQEQKDLFEIIYNDGYKREEFLDLLPEADGLIVRSSTTVDKEAITRAKKLKIIVRAGVGVDNIDLSAASHAGIIVENAPGGNSVSTAEQTLALLFASARHVAQADASMKSGKWEKSKFKGKELTNKTLGVVGLGRIGKEVVARAKGLKMKIIAYDPYIPPENLEQLQVELVEQEAILARSDFITVHTPLTESTRDFINKQNLSQLKNGVALINVARGGIYNEEALVEGLSSGKIASVALDVFTEEPLPAHSPLRQFENCIMTPHLGASTGDAELAVAMETVDAIEAYFKDGVAHNALNFPAIDVETMDFLKPYYNGGIRVGKLLGQLGKDICKVRIGYYGTLAEYKTAPVTSAIQYGLLTPAMGEEVNIVSAPLLAKSRGMQVVETHDHKGKGFSSFIEIEVTDSHNNNIALQYTCLRKQPLIFSLFHLPIEFKPEGIILSIKNEDLPGVVGTIGNFLGDQGVNIAHLELSRHAKGDFAYCIISVDELLSREALEQLQNLNHIISTTQIDLR